MTARRPPRSSKAIAGSLYAPIIEALGIALTALITAIGRAVSAVITAIRRRWATRKAKPDV